MYARRKDKEERFAEVKDCTRENLVRMPRQNNGDSRFIYLKLAFEKVPRAGWVESVRDALGG